MISRIQTETIAKLNEYFEHWRLWYKWEQSPFNIKEKELFETLLDEARPVFEFQTKYRIDIASAKRCVEQINKNLDKPKYGENYLKFVSERVNLVTVSEEEYLEFKAWKKNIEESTIEQYTLLLMSRKHRRAIEKEYGKEKQS